ncbi:MAG: hypothetical protein AUK47_14995 [Deltaproteobacteria bacterium CG2_30_63_29]|nr:MAG: hypothetical protein AUK47_14995 [Deltaproteobacteria bacterium CG2_30_63_29]PJB43068.1 MAG: hypothetical protein CO108_10670 [Deltaproteobacteria bacterium CG_4_9_14_3_um_filter_63_12]
MIRSLSILIVVTTLLFVSSAAWSQIPRTLTHQGFLTENDAPLTGLFDVRFSLYPDEIDNANLLFSETLQVSFEQGYYSVVLGKDIPLDLAALRVPKLFLEVTLRPGGELQEVVFAPRQEITSVPFAIAAESVVCEGCIKGSLIAPQGVSRAAIADESISAAKISAGAIGASAIAPASIDSTKIVDQSLTGEDIQDRSLSGSEIQLGTLRTSEIDPTGGVYSSKSAIYIEKTTLPIQASQCGTITASCRAATDLPLQGDCVPPGLSNASMQATQMSGWDNGEIASFACTICNKGTVQESVTVSIACIPSF